MEASFGTCVMYSGQALHVWKSATNPCIRDLHPLAELGRLFRVALDHPPAAWGVRVPAGAA
eukprot:4466709-Pyramimonas_sp.AAC.1